MVDPELDFQFRVFSFGNQANIFVFEYESAERLDLIPVPVAAEAIMDRLCSQAYRIVIKGKSP